MYNSIMTSSGETDRRVSVRKQRWITVLVATISIYTWMTQVSEAQKVPHLTVAVAAVQSEAIEGEQTWWQITLTNESASRITQIEFGPAGHVWTFPHRASPVDILAQDRNTSVETAAIPLKAGDLRPAIGVTYTVGSETHYQIAVADDVVHVLPVNGLIDCSAVPQQVAARRGKPLPVQVWISNRSPFPLTDLGLSGLGNSLLWSPAAAVGDLSSGQTSSLTLVPTVLAERPQIALSLSYRWRDVTGGEHVGRALCQSDPVPLEEPWWKQIPISATTGLIGTLVGGLTGLVPWLIREGHERRKARQTNRERVLGMLKMITMEALCGANQGVSVPLVLLEKLFSEEGLFAALKDLDKALSRTESGEELVTCVQLIWETAYLHNDRRKEPYGTGRSTDLRDQAQRLSKYVRQLTSEPASLQVF